MARAPKLAEVMAEDLRRWRASQLHAEELAAERERLTGSFRDYARAAFEVVEGGDAWADLVRRGRRPPKHVDGWHLDAIADHLQAVARGQIRKLLINVPPGTSKSEYTCILWPTWMWIPDPSLRFLFSSYSEDFTKRDARKSKALIQSDWYSTRFPDVEIAPTPDTQLEYHTTKGGERHGASTNSGVTGKHVHGIVEDDPLKAQDAYNESARKAAWDYHTETLSFRLLPEAGWRVLVMQRLHADDPAGRILKRMEKAGGDPDGWVHLNLPMEFESKRRCRTSLPWEDPRKEDGELLWPQRIGPARVRELKGPHGLGAAGWVAQGQQRPGSEEETKVQKGWWKRWRGMPECDLVFSSWDMKLKLGGKSWVSGQVWGRRKPNLYKLYAVRFRGDILKTLEEVRAVAALFSGEHEAGWPRATMHLVEDAANGPAVMALLQSELPGMVPVKTGNASKAARLAAVTPFVEGGNCFLPADELASWKGTTPDEFIEEVFAFPNGGADDQVDAFSQAAFKGFEVGKRRQAPTGRMDFSAGARENPWDVTSGGGS